MKKKNQQHFNHCHAPICMDDESPQVVWWAGEEICSRRPLTELQKRQKRINEEYKKGRFLDQCWTRAELENSAL